MCAGFLYRDLKDRYWWFGCVTFITSFFLALQAALAPSISLKTFLSSLCFSIGIVGSGLFVPYRKWADNLVSFAAIQF